MRRWRRLWRKALRAAGLGPKPAPLRAGADFCGILAATEADIPAIVAFELAVFRDHESRYAASFQIPETPAEIIQKYERRFVDPDHGIALHVAEGRCHGYIAWWLFWFAGAWHATVMSIGVDSDCRRAGIGRALLRHARAQAAARGATFFHADVWRHNTASRALFESEGFDAVNTRYVLPLSGAGALPEARP